MFTGIIQGLGQINALSRDRVLVHLLPETAQKILPDLELGDSVAVDGVCLTAEEVVSEGFVASVSPETLQRSTLEKASQTSAYVNIESSLRAGGKIGGHFVSGHVDGIGSLVKSVNTQTSWELTFSAPSGLTEQWQQYLSRFLVSKGSIAVNGISLTIADCDEQGSWFRVAVIPVTYGETNLSYLKIGDWVNLEGDILGKYVEKLLGDRRQSPSRQEEISLAFLSENGYG